MFTVLVFDPTTLLQERFGETQESTGRCCRHSVEWVIAFGRFLEDSGQFLESSRKVLDELLLLCFCALVLLLLLLLLLWNVGPKMHP